MATRPIEIKLDEIIIDGGTQPRTAIDEEVVAEYAEAADELPAVDVFRDGARTWLADGFHRYHARRQAGKKTVLANVHRGTLRDAILFSVGANARHGLRRTNADKRKAVETLLRDKEWGKWSDSQIAQRCGVGNQLVGHVRASLCDSQSETRIYTTKHGTQATMNTANIGRRLATPPPPPTANFFGDDEDEEEGTSQAETVLPKAAPSAPPPTDQEGGLLTRPELVEVFRRRSELHELTSQVSEIKVTVMRALDAGDELFRYVDRTDFQARAENLFSAIKFALPHALCPAHADDPVARRGCKWCGGSGWLPKDKWEAAMKAHKGRKSA